MKNNFKYIYDIKNLNFKFSTNLTIFTENSLKNFFFLFKFFLNIINKLKKNKLLLNKFFIDSIKISLDFLAVINDIISNKIFFNKYKHIDNYILKDYLDYNYTYIYCDFYKEHKFFFLKNKLTKDRFNVFKWLKLYNEYWSSLYYKDNFFLKVTNKNPLNKTPWPIFEITDKNIIKRTNIDDDEMKSNLYSNFKQKIKYSNPLTLNVKFKTLKRQFTLCINKLNSSVDLNLKNLNKYLNRSYTEYNNSKGFFHKLYNVYIFKHNNLKSLNINLNKNDYLYRRELNPSAKYKLHTIKKNIIFYPQKKILYFSYKKYLKNNKKNLKFFKFFLLKKKINFKKKKNNTIFFKNYNSLYLLKRSNIKHDYKFRNVEFLRLKFLKNTNLYKNIKNENINDCNIFKFKQFKLELSDYIKFIDNKKHLLSIYSLSKSLSLNNNNKIFLFTSNNIINNINFFFQYLSEKWLLKLMFNKNIHVNWFVTYFLKISDYSGNINLFFNFNNLYITNIVKPADLPKKNYSELLFQNFKIRINNVINLLSDLIYTYFHKFFYGNYNFIMLKMNENFFDISMSDYFNQLIKTITFESIRFDFIYEFVYVCALTFYIKDPKPLVKWIVKVIHKINHKKHWKFLYLLKINIFKVAFKFFDESNLIGFNIVIKGKIGALGSVRKKIFHIRLGQYGYSRYYLGGDIYYLSALTKTGKIGINMVLTYSHTTI